MGVPPFGMAGLGDDGAHATTAHARHDGCPSPGSDVLRIAYDYPHGSCPKGGSGGFTEQVLRTGEGLVGTNELSKAHANWLISSRR